MRKALVEYPSYNKEENEYDKYVPDTSPRRLVSDPKGNSAIGTTNTYKNKELRKYFLLFIFIASYLKKLLSD